MSSFRLIKWPLLVIVSFLAVAHVADSLRVKLYPNEEPTSAQVYNNYRMIMAEPYYYYLKSAGLLNESIIDKYHLEDYKNPDGSYAKGTFAFDSSEYFRKRFTVQWFVPWAEHSALQIYDNRHDIARAAGPQVDQELCGLHLDYMIHMTKKYNTNMANATELSIFAIMNAYGIPRPGVIHGNTYSPGDYELCKSTQLNVMKRELALVNRTAAEIYFKTLAEEQLEKPSSISQILYTIRQYIGPFFGFAYEQKGLSLDEYSDKIKALPMRYCMNRIRWPSWVNSSHTIRNYVFTTAACLPESCDSSSLKPHYDKIMELTRNQMSQYYDGLYISDLFCLPDERSELRNPFNYLSTVVFMIFNGIWLSLIVVATIMSCRDSKRKRNQQKLSGWKELLMSWSLKKNLRDFVAAAPGDGESRTSSEGAGKSAAEGFNNKHPRINTAPLEGFKVLSSFLVITSHACIIGFTLVWNPKVGHDMISKGILAVTNTIGPAVVDNFFVVSAMITARILLSMPQKTLTKPTFWIKFMIYRYIRIIPLYLFIHWFLQSSFRFLGDGPFWDYGTSHTAWTKLCQDESWWTMLLPSANFKSPGIHCNGVGWYLASDLQFMLLTPFVIVLLMKRPLVGHATVLIGLIAMAVNHVLFFLKVDQDIKSLFEINLMSITRVLDDTTEGYTYPQYRYTAFLIGLAAGHFLHLYERGIIKKWPRAFITYGKAYTFFIIYLLGFLPYISSLLPTHDENFMRIFGAFREGTIHIFISVAAAIFILFLCTNHLRAISVPYSWYIFRPLSNASLSTLLVHIPVIFYNSQNFRTLPELSTYYIITTTSLWIVQAVVLSVVVHLLYELPMRRFLVKSLTKIFSESRGKVEHDKKEKTK